MVVSGSDDAVNFLKGKSVRHKNNSANRKQPGEIERWGV